MAFMFSVSSLLVRRSCRLSVASVRSIFIAAASTDAVPAVLDPAPGTVTPYSHHIFIRTSPPSLDYAGPGAWWPKVVER